MMERSSVTLNGGGLICHVLQCNQKNFDCKLQSHSQKMISMCHTICSSRAS